MQHLENLACLHTKIAFFQLLVSTVNYQHSNKVSIYISVTVINDTNYGYSSGVSNTGIL